MFIIKNNYYALINIKKHSYNLKNERLKYINRYKLTTITK